jgi:hypothetical protein
LEARVFGLDKALWADTSWDRMLLPELPLAHRWELGAFELARDVRTHPTLSEALQDTFHGLAGHMINL